MRGLRWKWPLVIAVFIAAVAIAGFARARKTEGETQLPSAPARSGEFLVIVQCRGELVALRSVQLVAPTSIPNLQIAWMASVNTLVKEGEPVVRFNPSSAQQQLREKEIALTQAQATLEQAVAQARITLEKDQREVAMARYQVERARLEASKQEIVSAIQGEESRIDLALAEERLRVKESEMELHKSADAAKIASLTRLRDKAKFEVELLQDRIARMELRAPSDGVTVYLNNTSQGWTNARPFAVGDNVWPGSVIAELPDLASLAMKGKVEEIDRARIAPGQEARILVDALPERPFRGRLQAVSALTEQNFEWPPTRNFRAFAEFLESDERLRPGMNGRLDVVVDRIPEAISIPAKAVFTRAGKPVAYISENGRYRAVEIEIQARNQDEVAVRGLDAGAMVALVEPETKDVLP